MALPSACAGRTARQAVSMELWTIMPHSQMQLRLNELV